MLFEGESWKFAGRSPYGLSYDQRFVIGHIHVPDSEPLIVCSEVVIGRRGEVRFWVIDQANQPLAEIRGSDVPKYNQQCRDWVLASARSASENEFWISSPTLREGFRNFFLPGVAYGFANSEYVFNDRVLISAVLIFEKFVEPMASRG
jgi:hypothetical protein